MPATSSKSTAWIRRRVTAILTISAVLAAASCGSDDSGDSADGTTTSEPPTTTSTIFDTAEDTVGITDDEINLCFHVTERLGQVLNTSDDDLRVYWDAINEAGGIHGRHVNVTFTDDQGTPQGGTQAAEQCKANEAFVMGGGIGFDTVPAVRRFAEDNNMLYFSSFATEGDIATDQHSFTFLPSIERIGDVTGRFVAHELADRPVGVVWRNSPNWQGGSDQFQSAVEAEGGSVVSDVPVEANQGDFTNAILALRDAGAEVVLPWIPIIDSVQLVRQAATQGYRPVWILAGFNIVADTLGAEIDGTSGQAAVGYHVYPPFPSAEGTAAAGVEEFLEAFAQFRPTKPADQINDIDWYFWLYSLQLHQLLDECGDDCTRNHLSAMIAGGYQAEPEPTCQIDFGRGQGRLGGFGLEISRAVPISGGVRWESTAHCAETFE
jgi:ABC-type branched-subunit amino acid transport system substrate-binding protein